MKKRMKFIGMSAAVLLALSPVVMPAIGATSTVVYADESYDGILKNAIQSNYTVEDWTAERILGLKTLVNSGATNQLYTGSITNNSFYTDILSSKIFNNQTLNQILGVAGASAKAQILVDGKSQVTEADLSKAQLTLTVKIFATNGKTAEAEVLLKTNAPELAINDEMLSLTQAFGADYVDFELNPELLTVANNDSNGSWSVDTVVSVTPTKERLVRDGILDSEGRYIKAGEYTQTITASLISTTGTEVLRTIDVTISVLAPNAADLKFIAKTTDAKEYANGSTVLQTAIENMDATVAATSPYKFEDNLILNSPVFFNFDTKVTNYGELDEVLKNRFIELFQVSNEISGTVATLPIQIDKLTVDSTSIDFSKAGIATVPFKYTTPNGQEMTLSLQLKMKNPGNPVFEFSQNQDITISIGNAFNLYDFKVYPNTNDLNNGNAAGNEGIGLLGGVTINGSVNTSKVGVYKITYTATNLNHLTTTLVRTINVIDPNEGNEKPEITNFKSVGYVDYITGYGIRVWGTPKGNGSSQFLPHATAWKIDQKATFKNGDIWYRVGKDQWVDGSYIKFSPVANDPGMNELKGVGTINYVPGYSINVYKGAEASSANWTGKQLEHGTKWRVYGEKNGFYNLGGNQWVASNYVTFIKD